MKKARATLDRVLSKAGIASRTTTREWIEEGRVKVNGRVIRNPDHWVETVKDVVHLDGCCSGRHVRPDGPDPVARRAEPGQGCRPEKWGGELSG